MTTLHDLIAERDRAYAAYIDISRQLDPGHSQFPTPPQVLAALRATEAAARAVGAHPLVALIRQMAEDRDWFPMDSFDALIAAVEAETQPVPDEQ